MADIKAAKAKAEALRKTLRQLDGLTGRAGIREQDNSRKRQSRAAATTVTIGKCKDRKWREQLEGNIFDWLSWYFADTFTYDFTPQQREMILAIQDALVNGDDQSIAASRGEGKTTLAECVLIYAILTGAVRFAVLFSATGADAEHSLDSIKDALVDNDLLQESYPEVCDPVRALENTPQRANSQRIEGERHDNGQPYSGVQSNFSWCGREITMPKVPGSPCAGAIIATRGLDSAVRGLKIGNRRPDLALIDDPDTIDTANSPEQAKKLEDKIDKAIGGLGGQKRRIARVMLTTLQNRTCVSYRFTDPAQKSSWRGKRFRFLVTPPARSDLWEEYVQLRQADWQNGTALAHEFYVANRNAMEEGAAVANPNRYTSGELSALQHYYNQVARLGADAVATEYDNDPPEETGPVESGITAHRIQRQLSGYERKIIPPGCTVLTQGIDCRKVALHWVVRAWRPDGTGFIIDYGVHEVLGTTYGSDEGLDVAVKRAILARLEESKASEYMTLDGELKPIDLSCVDAGWQTSAVYSACAEAGLGVMPIMGFGKSAGCAQANFSDIQRRTNDKKPGDGWFLSRKGTIWLVCSDADRWKTWEHDRWMTATDKPGTMMLYGEGSGIERLSDDEKRHFSYAKHICAEVEIEEPYNGTIRRKWKNKSDNNHWLDASAYCNVAANIKGIRLISTTAKIPKSGTSPASRPTAQQLAARARR